MHGKFDYSKCQIPLVNNMFLMKCVKKFYFSF